MRYLIKMFSLEGKSVVVTCGGGILGSEVARTLGRGSRIYM